MSVENDTVSKEPEGEERREPNGQRIPYEGLVELGGALGPSFEAQSVDVSRGGMHLRTAYLPEVGQPLTCRFDAGTGEVLASGEVVWRHEEERGGEFAIRFGQLDAESAATIGQIVGPVEPCEPKEPGTRVRLHIDGLGSPMRARVKGSCASELTVGSDLGFLQVGKHLELEDATTGGKRPARIDRVEVEINEVSRIPQLVVTLRYEDEPHVAGAPVRAGSKHDGTPEPSVIDEEEKAAVATAGDYADALEQMQKGVKGAFARGAAQVGPAMSKLFKRARTTVSLLATRTRTPDETPAPARRTTAPAPSGGLHATGRRVVRSEPVVEVGGTVPATLRGGRRIAVAGAVLGVALIAFLTLRKPSTSLTSAATADSSAPQGTVPPSLPASTASAPLDMGTTPTLAAQPPSDLQGEPASVAAPTAAEESEHGHRKPGHVTPFGSGAVTHGNILRIKMDGVIEKIEGASLPTGFTVVVPNRRSLEAAAPLASRDSRIGSIRVANEAHGAELTVVFKDGVPNYQVRAKGDTLELVLASTGRVVETEAAHELNRPVAKKPHRLTHDKN